MKSPLAADGLRPRELEILRLVRDGLNNEEIADRLALTVGTVRWYLKGIYSKLDTHNREQAVARAHELHLLSASAPISRPANRHKLPRQLTPFFGRRSEMETLTGLLADPDVALVTILAPGGMGKTRLGLAAAEQQLSRFADGVFFVPLAGLSTADTLVTTIAETADFALLGGGTPKQQLFNYFRARRVLLVLDNFEQMIESGVLLVRDLLEGAPGVKVLATSREKLNLSGERVLSLAGLYYPGESTQAHPDDEAVQLFLYSARGVGQKGEIQTENLGAVARICRLTAGMPLALVLAASWLDMLTLDQIAAELQRGLDILASEWRDLPERQRSIRATFNTSWDRLSDAERSIFMTLSMFRSGFTAEAAQAVAGADLLTLRRLVNKALVWADSSGRYDMHELLRQYGEERLEAAGATETVRAAHSAYYMDYLAVRTEDLKGRRQDEALAEIRVDVENIRQAWVWAAEHRQVEAINAALDALESAFQVNNLIPDQVALLRATLKALEALAGDEPHPVWDRTALRLQGATFALEIGVDVDLLQAVLARARQRGDRQTAADCLCLLGAEAMRQRDFVVCLGYYEECLILRRGLGDEYYLAYILSAGFSMAHYRVHGDTERSLRYDQEATAIRRRIGDRRHLAFGLQNKANQLIFLGRLTEAEAAVDEVLDVEDELNKTVYHTWTCTLSSHLSLLRGDFATATRQVEAGMAFAREHNYPAAETGLQAALSLVLSMDGDYRGALDLFAEHPSSRLHPIVYIMGLWAHALAACGLGDDPAGRESLRRMLQFACVTLPSPTYQTLCLPLATVLAARAGQSERAVELLGLVSTAPKEMIGWMAKWPLLAGVRQKLEVGLGQEAYRHVFQRGEGLALATVVCGLRAEYDTASP